ncbi:hypothetical protein IG631_17121 [Alternaria alternata]|jgi:hypothetical protein|nr:hypothetical protein IG631_17121 [Alternaria alternata]
MDGFRGITSLQHDDEARLALPHATTTPRSQRDLVLGNDFFDLPDVVNQSSTRPLRRYPKPSPRMRSMKIPGCTRNKTDNKAGEHGVKLGGHWRR